MALYLDLSRPCWQDLARTQGDSRGDPRECELTPKMGHISPPTTGSRTAIALQPTAFSTAHIHCQIYLYELGEELYEAHQGHETSYKTDFVVIRYIQRDPNEDLEGANTFDKSKRIEVVVVVVWRGRRYRSNAKAMFVRRK